MCWGRETAHCVLLVLLLVSVMTGSVFNKGNKHKPWIEAEYQGIVMENDRTVLLNPPLFAIDKDAPLHYAGEICGFKIHGANVPFEVLVVDRQTGEGLIRVKDHVNCEEHNEHTFTMQAHDCGEDEQRNNVKRSHKAVVHVRVNDVNEFVPVFRKRVYRATVNEGRLAEAITKVEAVDGDCSPQYSQICFYKILTPGVPFAIDNDGNIRNTGRLSVTHQSLYTFIVTAYDCGKKRSVEDAHVEIQVKPVCTPAWHDATMQREYSPGSGAMVLFPRIRLELCDQTIGNVESTVRLETGHVAKGCDRDNYAAYTLRKLCGASPGGIDLLPAPGGDRNWTWGLQLSQDPDTSAVYTFNGSEAALPPPGLQGLDLTDHFTLSFWLRRAYAQHRGLETVICSTQGTDEGYTHYSVMIRACWLFLVYWPQVQNVHPMMFYWTPNQLCDAQWHHYSLHIEFPSVTLYIDAASYDAALTHDRELLSPPRPEPQLVIGACHHDNVTPEHSNQTVPPGAVRTLRNHLWGLLSGVSLRAGPEERREVLECLYSCKEGLDFRDFDSLGKGMKIHISPSQSMLTLEGEDPQTVSRALGHVTYRNALRYATYGARPLSLTTTVRCLNEAPCPDIPTILGSVTVLPPDSPTVQLSGSPHLARPADDFEGPRGVSIFPQLHITSSLRHRLREGEGGGESPSAVEEALLSDEMMHNLDSCKVVVLGDVMDPYWEALSLDQHAVSERGFLVDNTSSIITISGVDSIAVYESILQSMRYRLRPGAAVFERRFQLQCSEMKGHYISNTFTVEVNVVHSVKAPVHPNHVLAAQQFVKHAQQEPSELIGHSVRGSHRTSVVPSAATVIIVVCVGFLVLIVVLGIARIQTLQTPGPRGARCAHEHEAFWDDSALTIIVNPIESYKVAQAEDGGGEMEAADPLTPGTGGAQDKVGGASGSGGHLAVPGGGHLGPGQ